jgi:hypothetical protein
MKSKKLLLFAFSLAMAAACASVASLPLEAQGARNQLEGAYFSAGEQACLVSPAGFTSDQVPLGPAIVQSSSVQGTLTFHLDGTGTAQFKELLITHPPAPNVGATSTEQSFAFTYTIADEGTLTLVVVGTVTGTVLTGSLKGAPFTLTNFPALSGRVARNGSAIAVSNTEPTVETLKVGPVTLPRICHRMRLLIPVHADGDTK